METFSASWKSKGAIICSLHNWRKFRVPKKYWSASNDRWHKWYFNEPIQHSPRHKHEPWKKLTTELSRGKFSHTWEAGNPKMLSMLRLSREFVCEMESASPWKIFSEWIIHAFSVLVSRRSRSETWAIQVKSSRSSKIVKARSIFFRIDETVVSAGKPKNFVSASPRTVVIREHFLGSPSAFLSRLGFGRCEFGKFHEEKL